MSELWNWDRIPINTNVDGRWKIVTISLCVITSVAQNSLQVLFTRNSIQLWHLRLTVFIRAIEVTPKSCKLKMLRSDILRNVWQPEEIIDVSNLWLKALQDELTENLNLNRFFNLSISTPSFCGFAPISGSILMI